MGSNPHVVEDFMGVLKVLSDGTILRSKNTDFKIPIINEKSIIFKDIIFDKNNNLHLRIYKPIQKPSPTKLPIILYLRGGGFCFGSRIWPNNHNCCLRLASSLNAFVITPDYRLAPEHRLPAALDDSEKALKWIQSQSLSRENCETWVSSDEVDFENVFVFGDSSGGNIAHHLAVRLGSGLSMVDPVRVRGYVLLAPFFGGLVRTPSEVGPSEALLNLEILDRFWRLSLPIEATRDHPFANPFGEMSIKLERVDLGPIMVIVGGDELLKDRAQDYAKRLEKIGKKIEYVEFKGKEHGFFTNDPYSEVSNQVLQKIKRFITHI